MYHARGYHCVSLICYTQSLGLDIQGSYEGDIEYVASRVNQDSQTISYAKSTDLGVTTDTNNQRDNVKFTRRGHVDVSSASLLGFVPLKVTLARKGKL